MKFQIIIQSECFKFKVEKTKKGFNFEVLNRDNQQTNILSEEKTKGFDLGRSNTCYIWRRRRRRMLTCTVTKSRQWIRWADDGVVQVAPAGDGADQASKSRRRSLVLFVTQRLHNVWKKYYKWVKNIMGFSDPIRVCNYYLFLFSTKTKYLFLFFIFILVSHSKHIR